MDRLATRFTILLLLSLLTGSVVADVPADCDPQEEIFSPIAKKCILCLNRRMVPKLEPSKCPPRTYYDEVDTCSCIPCEMNNCCPGGDIMRECPTGSYQPKKGQKTCELAGLLTTTWGFKYDANSVLNKNRNTPQQVVRTKRYFFDKCQNKHVGQSMAVLSGITLNINDPKISIKVSAKSTGIRTTQLTVSKVAMSRIEGYAVGTVDACVPPDTVMTMSQLRAQGITAGNPKSRSVITNMKCAGSIPRVFAAISELVVSGSNKRLSLSVSSTVRLNDNGLVRSRVNFGMRGPGIVTGGAGVLTFCTSQNRLLAAGMIQTGLINGNDIVTRGVRNKYGQVSITKSVKFSSAMMCNDPVVLLGLTKVDATRNAAINLELLGATRTRTGFQMKFVLMGGTKVTALEGTYLATCQVGGQAVLNSIKRTCAPRAYR